MPLLTLERIIEEYHIKVKEKYPNISKELFEKICKTPFHFIKDNMQSPSLPAIFIPEFATLAVTSKHMKAKIRENNSDLRYKLITPEKHLEKQTIYLDILKRVEEYETKTPFEIIGE